MSCPRHYSRNYNTPKYHYVACGCYKNDDVRRLVTALSLTAMKFLSLAFALILLTFADARAVNADASKSWHGTLIQDQAHPFTGS